MLKRIVVTVLMLSLAGCVVVVRPHDYPEEERVSRPVEPTPPPHAYGAPREQKRKSFSRNIVLTLDPQRGYRVDGRYLQARLNHYGAKELRMRHIERVDSGRAVWRVDGLHSEKTLHRLMKKLAAEPEIVRVQLYSRAAVAPRPKPRPQPSPGRVHAPLPVIPPHAQRPVTPVTPAPGHGKRAPEMESVSLIVGLQPQAGKRWPAKLLPVLSRKCLGKGESLSFQRTLASGGHLLVARIREGEPREKALFRCLEKQPQVRFAEENERRHIQGGERPEGRRNILR